MSNPPQNAPKLSSFKYLVEAVLASGEIETVMRVADQAALGKPYGLKLIKNEGELAPVLIDAARAAADASKELGHPAVLRYIDFRLRKAWFKVTRGELLMEYVPGSSLAGLQGASVPQLALIFRAAAAGISHMHRRGILHGALSRSRVLLSKSGDVKVAGYGLGRMNPELMPKCPVDRNYVAPEQLKSKKPTELADVYAFGALMYHAAAGQPANVGRRSVGEASKISTPSALNRDIPVQLNNVIVSCLQMDEENRPKSMYDVHESLDRLVKILKYEESASLKGLGREHDQGQ